ncbi:MAG: hypothetical protein ACOCTJ_02980 [Desulfobia sp.]
MEAPDREKARHKVNLFLEQTTLIRYSAVEINDSLSFTAADESFWEQVDQGIAGNREAVADLCRELSSHGYDRTADLQSMPQGFESKVLHTLVHLLDGFIGVDSDLYNLVEGSHWVSSSLRRAIVRKPDRYHLVYMDVGEVQKTVFHD